MRLQRLNLVRPGREQQYGMLVVGVVSGPSHGMIHVTGFTT